MASGLLTQERAVTERRAIKIVAFIRSRLIIINEIFEVLSIFQNSFQELKIIKKLIFLKNHSYFDPH